mgnify:CR=1 FL=1
MGFGAVNVDLNPGGILKAIFDGIDALTTSDEEKQSLKNEALDKARQGDLQAWGIQAGLLTAQMAVNKAEAESGNIWASGWRPSIGWTCSAALFFQFVLAPIGMWAAANLGHPLPDPPRLDDMLWELMFGMLGIGVLRTVEKLKGVAS